MESSVVKVEGGSQQQISAPPSQFEVKLENEFGVDMNQLRLAIGVLPQNYNFEIPKTLCRILECKQSLKKDKLKVSLQFPEGLLLFSTLISDILQSFGKVECLLLGDVTYGACCVDDLASRALGCEFIVHYGHSCLVPIQELTISNALYVFVEISIDVEHFVNSVVHNFKPEEPLLLLGVVQFNKSLFIVKTILMKEKGFQKILLPQEKPRSAGEVLGCTSPVIPESDEQQSVIFISDGRFHIESTMIRNPHLRFFQYNPYSKELTSEVYETEKMHEIRLGEIEKAKSAHIFGIILGTLGRQGNVGILQELQELMEKKGKRYIVVFLSEITAEKLARFQQVGAWVQIACPRLSIDWGHFFKIPLLSTYECFVCLNELEWQKVYPMDYYSYAGGRWSNYYKQQQLKQTSKKKTQKAEIKLEYEKD